MNKYIVLAVSGIALAAVSAPASAAVGGARIEAVGGYDNVRYDLSGVGLNGHLSKGGLVYGVGAGYDFAVAPKVGLGIDLEATEATTRIRATSGTTTDQIKASRDLYVGGRLTTAISSTANLYLTAGYTNARLKAKETVGGATTLQDATNLDGFRAGIGVQFAVGEHAYIGGEYRYSNYQSNVTRNQGVATLGFRF